MNIFLRKLLCFSAIGVFGTAAHFAVLVASIELFSIGPTASSIFGFAVGALVNYFLNYHFTFASKQPHVETCTKFFTIATIGMGLNTIIMLISIDFFHYLISQTIATSVVLTWNFLCNNFWTFSEEITDVNK